MIYPSLTPTNRLKVDAGGAISNKARRRLGWSVVVVALFLSACGRPETASEPTRAVRTHVVGVSAVSFQQEYAGEVRARTESRLAFRVAGKLVDRQVQAGDSVRKGQVLARLDPQDLRLVEQAAQAAVLGARVNAQQSEADLNRFKGLFEQGFISAAELERRNTAAAAAGAQYEQAKAQAAVQGRQTQFGTLTADANGVITAVDAEPGAVLVAGAPVVRLAWDGPRDVVFAVPEDQVGAMRSAIDRRDALAVRLWGEEQVTRLARIREIAAAADPVTRTFQVKAEMTDQNVGQRPRIGQTAVVTMRRAADTALKLPLTALIQQQGRTAVWVLDAANMAVKSRPILVSVADGNEAVVSSGLAAGDEVITAGVHVLTEGQRVKRWVDTPTAGAPAASAAVVSR